MTLTLSTAGRNAAADAVTALMDGGTLELRSGTGTVVAAFALPSPAFAAAADGVATGNGVPMSTTANAGTIASARILNSVGVPEITGLTVTLTGGGGDIELTNLSPGAGSTVEIASLSYTQPAA